MVIFSSFILYLLWILFKIFCLMTVKGSNPIICLAANFCIASLNISLFFSSSSSLIMRISSLWIFSWRLYFFNVRLFSLYKYWEFFCLMYNSFIMFFISWSFLNFSSVFSTMFVSSLSILFVNVLSIIFCHFLWFFSSSFSDAI